MNIENLFKLKEGMVIKNYKEMCELLGEKSEAGNSKKAQLREWERFFKYHKEGHKIVIDKLYDEPREKIDLRGSDGLLSNDIQPLILDLLVKNNHTDSICFSCTKLLEMLKMVNANYHVGRRNIKLFSKYLEVDEDIVNDFYYFEHSKLKSSLESALDALYNKRLISWEKITMVCVLEYSLTPDQSGKHELIKINRPATNSEIEFLLSIDRKVLDHMGLGSTREVYGTSRYSTFKRLVNEELKKSNSNILYGYKGYKIIQLKDYVIKALEEENKKLKEQELNFNILKSAYKSIKNKSANAKNSIDSNWGMKQDPSRLHITRTKDNYENDSIKVCNTIIDLSSVKIDIFNQYYQ